MNKSDQAYLTLLRSALWEEEACGLDHVDWNEVFEIARRQTTMGLVSDAALQCEAGQAMPEKGKAYLRQQMISLAMSHQCINTMIARIVKALRDNGIESVLMKGQGLAANYPIPELRPCGDIDLYVGKEKYEAACDLLNVMAGEAAAAQSNSNELHYYIMVDGISIEIHRLTSWFNQNGLNDIYDSFSVKGMTVGSNALMVNGVKVWLPEDTFNALFVFHHTFRHFISGGIGVRQLCDWTMLLHAKHESINREELSDMLCRLQLMDAWQVFGCIAVDWLGLPQEEMPFYEGKCRKRAKRTINLILKEGAFGKKFKLLEKYRQQKKFIRRLISFCLIQTRFMRLLGIFPKNAWYQYRKKMVSSLKWQ